MRRRVNLVAAFVAVFGMGSAAASGETRANPERGPCLRPCWANIALLFSPCHANPSPCRTDPAGRTRVEGRH